MNNLNLDKNQHSPDQYMALLKHVFYQSHTVRKSKTKDKKEKHK